MKRCFVAIASLFLLGLAGCDEGPAVIVRTAVNAEAGADATPLTELPIRLLPYDRDAIFDSLTAAAREPEPQVPAELLAQLRSLEQGEVPVKQPGDTTALAPEQLRTVLQQRVDSLRAARRMWADSAFARFDEAVTARLEAVGREELVDTTDAAGTVRFRAPEPGRWWVYTRYTLPDRELYWNVPIELQGDSVAVPLTAANAEERPLF